MDICAVNLAGVSICKVVGVGLAFYFLGPILLIAAVIVIILLIFIAMLAVEWIRTQWMWWRWRNN